MKVMLYFPTLLLPDVHRPIQIYTNSCWCKSQKVLGRMSGPGQGYSISAPPVPLRSAHSPQPSLTLALILPNPSPPTLKPHHLTCIAAASGHLHQWPQSAQQWHIFFDTTVIYRGRLSVRMISEGSRTHPRHQNM